MPSKENKVSGARIEIRNLVKNFDAVKAVDNLSLVVESGSFLTFLGPSGSGKTTTLNMIAGFETPTRGEIIFDGKPITSDPPYKRNIGMVFQNYALFPHMTAGQNIAYPLKMRRLDKKAIHEKVNEILEIVKLAGFGNRYPKQLSGGQQQRIALARALVYKPTLLLMDEPLGALDKKLREHMQIEIKHIQNQLGITVIYVTHDQEEAMTMSDRIAILNNGRLEQLGSPLEIYNRPNNQFIADFIGETNLLDGEIRIENNMPVLELSDLKARFPLSAETTYPAGKIQVSIRPEKIWLEKISNTDSSFSGKITELIYVGESTKYIVQSCGKTITIKKQNSTETLLLRRGDEVSVCINPVDLVIFQNRKNH